MNRHIFSIVLIFYVVGSNCVLHAQSHSSVELSASYQRFSFRILNSSFESATINDLSSNPDAVFKSSSPDYSDYSYSTDYDDYTYNLKENANIEWKKPGTYVVKIVRTYESEDGKQSKTVTFTRSVTIEDVEDVVSCVTGEPSLSGSSFVPITNVALGSGSESRTFTFNANGLPTDYNVTNYSWNLYYNGGSSPVASQSGSSKQFAINFSDRPPGTYRAAVVTTLTATGCDNLTSTTFDQSLEVSCEPKAAELSPTWGSQARSEVEITSPGANMTFTLNQGGSLPEGVTGPVNAYAWFLEKPDGTRQTLGTLQSQTIDFPSYGLGRYRVIAQVSAPTDACYTLQPDYVYTVDVNPPCPSPAPTLSVSRDNVTEIEQNVYRVNNKDAVTLQINRSGLSQQEQDYLYAAYQWQTNDFPSDGVTISPSMSGSTTRPGNQVFTLNFTKSGKYEFVVRGINNCSRIPTKVTFYVFFTEELDDFSISQVCPPTLPDDMKALLNDFVEATGATGLQEVLAYEEVGDQVIAATLSDFHYTVESSIGVIIKPGVVLTNGARLTVVSGDGEDGNGVGGDDVNYNYTLQTSFDDFRNVIAQSKQYFDAQGRLIQSQSKDLERGVVLASQTVYDRYGRAGAVSLPAPVRASSGGGPLSAQCPDYVAKVKPVQFGFVDKLLLNPEGNPYSANDVYEHRPVKDQVGSIGWYYSEQNQGNGNLAENNVATTKYPITQTLYRGDGSGEVVAQTLPGDQWYEEYEQTVPGPNGEDVIRDRIRVVHTARSEVQPLDLSSRYDSDLIKTYFKARQTDVDVSDPFGDSYTPIDPYLRDGYYKRVSWDANGRKSVAYYNEAEQLLINHYYGNQSEPITESFSYYDDRGRLVGSRDPKKLVTRYEYDFRGRMLSMDEPDAGKTEYVYRRDGSIRFSQNAKQAAKNQNQYSYTHYDQAGRPTESGEWTPNDASVSIRTLRTNKDLLEARNQDLPEGARADVVKTTYDKAVALPEGITGRTAQFLMGKVSYSEKLQSVAQPDGQLLLEPVSKSWYSYDERGRVTWMVQDIAGLGSKTVDYAYGPAGNVQLVSYQADNEGEDFYHYYEYDADTRLKEVYTSANVPVYQAGQAVKLLDEEATKAAFDLQATYAYYLHGPLKQVVLADGLQNIDYYYTVQCRAGSKPSTTPMTRTTVRMTCSACSWTTLPGTIARKTMVSRTHCSLMKTTRVTSRRNSGARRPRRLLTCRATR